MAGGTVPSCPTSRSQHTGAVRKLEQGPSSVPTLFSFLSSSPYLCSLPTAAGLWFPPEVQDRFLGCSKGSLCAEPMPHSPSPPRAPSVPWHPAGAPARAGALVSPTGLLLKCSGVKYINASVQGAALWLGKQMSGNTFRKRKPPVEMQSAGSHAAEQDSWAAPAASWQVSLGKTEQSCMLSAPSKSVLSSTEAKFQIFTPVLASGRNPPVFPDSSSCIHPCTPFPFPSHWCSSSTAVFGQDVTLEQQTWIFLLIRASRLGSWSPCGPGTPSPAGTDRISGNSDYGLPHHVVAPITTGQLAGRGEQHCTLCFTPSLSFAVTSVELTSGELKVTLGGVRFSTCEWSHSLLCSSLAPTKAIKGPPVPFYPHSLCLPPNALSLNEPWLPHCRGERPWMKFLKELWESHAWMTAI